MSVNAEEKIKINKTQLESILRLGFTQRQVCDFFGTSKSSLLRFVKENYNGRTFEQIKAEYTAQTQSMIMLNLLNLSKKNANVAIFLAKSVCGLNENYAAPSNDDAETAFAGALRKASRLIGNSKDLVSVPDRLDDDAEEED